MRSYWVVLVEYIYKPLWFYFFLNGNFRILNLFMIKLSKNMLKLWHWDSVFSFDLLKVIGQICQPHSFTILAMWCIAQNEAPWPLYKGLIIELGFQRYTGLSHGIQVRWLCVLIPMSTWRLSIKKYLPLKKESSSKFTIFCFVAIKLINRMNKH